MSITLYKKGKGVNLKHQNYFFIRNSKYSNKIYWRCINPNCRTRLTSNFNITEIISQPYPEHNHFENAQYSQKLEMRRNFNAEINRNPLQPVSQSYENVVIQQNSTPLIQSFQEIKSSLYRHRNLQLPRLPRSIRGLSITGQWAETLGHERFLLKIDRN